MGPRILFLFDAGHQKNEWVGGKGKEYCRIENIYPSIIKSHKL